MFLLYGSHKLITFVLLRFDVLKTWQIMYLHPQVAHAVTTRLSVRKGKAEQRLCKVVESPYLGRFGRLLGDL